jgi:hypothetical protein
MTDAGVYTSPSLDLVFDGRALDPRITFTRGSTATYFDSNGTMQTATTNAPRWDYDPVTRVLRGLLVEEARTNLFLQSADVSNAAWSKQDLGSGAPTVTANQAAAPDGTISAARVAYPAAASGGTVVAQALTVTANPYSFSVWMKSNVGGEQLYLMVTPDGVLYYRTLAVLTTSWQRFTLVTAALPAGTAYPQIGIDLRDASQSNKPAQTVFIWGAQVEQGAFPTSYIPTTVAAVTRAYDLCFISPANMAPWFVAPGGSWMAEFINNVPTPTTGTSPRVVGIHDGSSITPLWISTPTPVINSYDGVVASNLINLLVLGAISKGASSWSPGNGRVCLNGGSIGTGAQNTGFAALATAGVGLGSGNPGVVNESITGYIRRVRYWRRVLSDAEMVSVTT